MNNLTDSAILLQGMDPFASEASNSFALQALVLVFAVLCHTASSGNPRLDKAPKSMSFHAFLSKIVETIQSIRNWMKTTDRDFWSSLEDQSEFPMDDSTCVSHHPANPTMTTVGEHASSRWGVSLFQSFKSTRSSDERDIWALLEQE